jgi:hypothetical protein
VRSSWLIEVSSSEFHVEYWMREIMQVLLDGTHELR